MIVRVQLNPHAARRVRPKLSAQRNDTINSFETFRTVLNGGWSNRRCCRSAVLHENKCQPKLFYVKNTYWLYSNSISRKSCNATAAVSPTTTEDHLPNVETEPEPETELVLREMRTEFGQSAFYRYVYKVLFVNILLVLLPLVTLIVLSVFVVRALRQTPSYRLSLVHTRPRGCSDPPATAKVALTNIREEEDLVVVDDEVEQHQQTAADNGEPASVRPARGSTVKEFRSQSKFSLKSLKVYET